MGSSSVSDPFASLHPPSLLLGTHVPSHVIMTLALSMESGPVEGKTARLEEPAVVLVSALSINSGSIHPQSRETGTRDPLESALHGGRAPGGSHFPMYRNPGTITGYTKSGSEPGGMQWRRRSPQRQSCSLGGKVEPGARKFCFSSPWGATRTTSALSIWLLLMSPGEKHNVAGRYIGQVCVCGGVFLFLGGGVCAWCIHSSGTIVKKTLKLSVNFVVVWSGSAVRKPNLQSLKVQTPLPFSRTRQLNKSGLELWLPFSGKIDDGAAGNCLALKWHSSYSTLEESDLWNRMLSLPFWCWLTNGCANSC